MIDYVGGAGLSSHKISLFLADQLGNTTEPMIKSVPDMSTCGSHIPLYIPVMTVWCES